MSKFSENPFVTPTILIPSAIAGAAGLYPAMAFLYRPLLADEVETELTRDALGAAYVAAMRKLILERVTFWSWSPTMEFVPPTEETVGQLKHGALRDMYMAVLGLAPSAKLSREGWNWPAGTDMADMETQQGKS